jgi:hypothetical protein
MFRILHCLESQLTDGGKFINPTHQPRFIPHKRYFSASGTDFCQRLSKLQGLAQQEGLGKLKKFIIHYLPNAECISSPRCVNLS